MAILLLFQTADTQSYGEVQESTKLNDEQLVKQVQSLVESKLLLTDNVSKILYALLLLFSNLLDIFKLYKEIFGQVFVVSSLIGNINEENYLLFCCTFVAKEAFFFHVIIKVLYSMYN